MAYNYIKYKNYFIVYFFVSYFKYVAVYWNVHIPFQNTVPRCAVPIISAISREMFENGISIVKIKKASKNFTATKNNVLFDAFEVTCVFPLSHDIISFPEIEVALVQSYCGSLSYRYGAPMLHIYHKIFIYEFILL